MHTYPFHAGDYLKDTAHWTEHDKLVQVKEGLLYDLAYRRLLDFYYGQEAGIPNKSQWVAIQIRMLAHVELVGRVLKEKFDLVDNVWHQKRADAEISKYQKRVDANRKNGLSGGRKPSGQPTDNPLGSKPRTRTRTKNHIDTPLPPGGFEGFDRFWSVYPRKVGKPKAIAAFAAALARGASADDVVAGLQHHLPMWAVKKASGEGDKIPHPSTWLNRDGWNDEVMPVGAPAGPGFVAPAETAYQASQRNAVAQLTGGLASRRPTALPLPTTKELPHADARPVLG